MQIDHPPSTYASDNGLRSPRRLLGSTPPSCGVHAGLLPKVLGAPPAGDGRGNVMIPAPYHGNKSGFDMVSEEGVWL